jgi:hypothetical protein
VKKSLDYVIDSFKNEQVLSASSKTSVGKWKILELIGKKLVESTK